MILQAKLETRASQLKASRRKPFTLIELLVVIAILAIIGGSIIAAYDGLDTKAADGVATNDVNAIDSAMRGYKMTQKNLPSNLESLLDNNATPFTYVAAEADSSVTALGANSNEPSFLHPSLSAAMAPATLTLNEINRLRLAGINKIRYMQTTGADEAVSAITLADSTGVALASTVTTEGFLSTIDMPSHAFEAPVNGLNRGRGFYLSLGAFGAAVPTNFSVEIWTPGTNNVNNLRVGAMAGAKLVALGIGPSSDLVKSSANLKMLGASPTYGGNARGIYNNYIALIDVDVTNTTANVGRPARLVAIVDSQGRPISDVQSAAKN